jgi:uncharacterized protein YjbJ (UPF0337 family)
MTAASSREFPTASRSASADGNIDCRRAIGRRAVRPPSAWRVVRRSGDRVRHIKEPPMNKHQVKGRINEAAGRVREAAGRATASRSQASQGAAQKRKGQVQATLGDAASAAGDALDGAGPRGSRSTATRSGRSGRGASGARR